jgi:hypothetical protein
MRRDFHFSWLRQSKCSAARKPGYFDSTYNTNTTIAAKATKGEEKSGL